MVEPINLLVEGSTDAPPLTRLLRENGQVAGPIHGFHGKSWIDQNVAKYNQAAKFGKWLVLRDLDQDASCAATLVSQLLPNPAEKMRLRIAVHEVEAWLLGDREGASAFFGVAKTKVPTDPESLLDPKQVLVNLCRRSSHRRIRQGMVPEDGSTAVVGPEYGGLVTEFANGPWSWKKAVGVCDSLRRLVDVIRTF